MWGCSRLLGTGVYLTGLYFGGTGSEGRSGRVLGEPGRESTAGGRESARRLQRVLLSRLFQGVENPEEATGILGGGRWINIIYVMAATRPNTL